MSADLRAGLLSARAVPADYLALHIPGDPVAWSRARTHGNRHFLDPKLAAYYGRVIDAWQDAGYPRIEGPLECRCAALFGRPAKHLRADGSLNPTGQRAPIPRPDLDNLALKAPWDALNKLAWADDTQFQIARCVKGWATNGTPPGLYLVAYALDSSDAAAMIAAITGNVEFEALR